MSQVFFVQNLDNKVLSQMIKFEEMESRLEHLENYANLVFSTNPVNQLVHENNLGLHFIIIIIFV